MDTSSSYTHLKFKAPFWLQWALHNSFKLYTLEAFSVKHNEALSQVLKIFQIQLKFFINAKVHSTICLCNECNKNLNLRIDLSREMMIERIFNKFLGCLEWELIAYKLPTSRLVPIY